MLSAFCGKVELGYLRPKPPLHKAVRLPRQSVMAATVLPFPRDRVSLFLCRREAALLPQPPDRHAPNLRRFDARDLALDLVQQILDQCVVQRPGQYVPEEGGFDRELHLRLRCMPQQAVTIARVFQRELVVAVTAAAAVFEADMLAGRVRHDLIGLGTVPADGADLQCPVELDRRPVLVRPEAIITRSQRIQQGADLRRRGGDPSLVNIVHSHACRSPERHARCGSAEQAEQHNGASHNPVHGRFDAGGNVIVIGTVPTRASFVLNVSGRPGTMGRINSRFGA
jgi:hypothetical protein